MSEEEMDEVRQQTEAEFARFPERVRELVDVLEKAQPLMISRGALHEAVTAKIWTNGDSEAPEIELSNGTFITPYVDVLETPSIVGPKRRQHTYWRVEAAVTPQAPWDDDTMEIGTFDNEVDALTCALTHWMVSGVDAALRDEYMAREMTSEERYN